MNKLNNITSIFVVLPSFSAGVVTNYYYDGTMLIAEETNGAITVYLYDSTGSPIGMKNRDAFYGYNVWDTYWFEKNLQGDIIAVYSDDGTKLISYTYDAWGNFTTQYYNNGNTSTARYNNLRYRGYYYDDDLGLYYLISRYYDSYTGRFINADKFVSTGQGLLGYNMYVYCNNNPINCVDYTGEDLATIIGIGALILYGLLFLTSDEEQPEPTPPDPKEILEDTKIIDGNPEKNIIDIEIHMVENFDGSLGEYVRLLANKLESDYSVFLNGYEIDRVQLYGEIYGHYIVWDLGFDDLQYFDSNPANITIYPNGKVQDSRWYINVLSGVLGVICYE